jgi:hypothetical protein
MIYCKITYTNNDNIFYTDKKGEHFTSLNSVSKFSQIPETSARKSINILQDTAVTIDGILIRKLKVDFLEIISYAKPLRTRDVIRIDYGQYDALLEEFDTKLVAGDGSFILFNTIVEALNFFVANGYEFVQAYTNGLQNGSKNTTHYILKKKNGKL